MERTPETSVCAICLSDVGLAAARSFPAAADEEAGRSTRPLDVEVGSEVAAPPAAAGASVADEEAETKSSLAAGSGEEHRLACGHVFHSACLLMWLARQPHCPVCRDADGCKGLVAASALCEAVPPERAALVVEEVELSELQKRWQGTLGAMALFFALAALVLVWCFT